MPPKRRSPPEITFTPTSKRRNTERTGRSISRYDTTPRLNPTPRENPLLTNVRIYDAFILHISGRDIWEYFNVMRGDYNSLANKLNTTENNAVVAFITTTILAIHSLYNQVNYQVEYDADMIKETNKAVRLFDRLLFRRLPDYNHFEAMQYLVDVTDFV